MYHSADDRGDRLPMVPATPTQVLRGELVEAGVNGARCTLCEASLDETDIAFAYAYRCAEAVQWNVARLFCWGCAPPAIQTPTLGATEVVVGGRLGMITSPTTRTQRPCLTELEVRAYSPPTEGSQP